MTPDTVLAFCFPTGLDADLDRHMRFWEWAMRGGADAEIGARFAGVLEAAAAGDLDHWAKTAPGRLALILVLDQFPRSIHRDSALAYAQDARALGLAEAGLANGDFAALGRPWERTMFALPLVHAEGPGHRARAAENVRLADETLALAPAELKPAYAFCAAQSRRHQAVIDAFGRHPHRNGILGRPSTKAERIYLERGDFPHLREVGT